MLNLIRRGFASHITALCLLIAPLAMAEPTTQPAASSRTPTTAAPEPTVDVTQMAVTGRIEGENITFTLDVTAKAKPNIKTPTLTLITGDLVLDELTAPSTGARITFDPDAHAYHVTWASPGPTSECKVTASFAARPRVVEKGVWREVEFGVPTSWLRQLEVACDRSDLEVQFPGAMRLDRKVDGEKLKITAVEGPGRPFLVRWKPRVEDLDAKLVVASQANTILTVSTGVLRIDSLFLCDISQGKMKDLAISLPDGLSVTQVRGAGIRDWQIIQNSAGGQVLQVVLSTPATQQYALQVLAESPLPRFPAEVDAPVLVPSAGIRATGSVVIGTDSAIQLVIKQTAGLSQVEPAAFPHVLMSREAPRNIPSGKAFFYTFPASPYQLKLALDDMVPAFDVTHRLVATLKEDDLTLDEELELDVRDAPIRLVTLEVPRGLAVAATSGPQVEDFTVLEAEKPGAPQLVTVRFKQPILGRTIVSMRLEMGKSPLDKAQQLGGVSVHGSKSERGYVVLAADNGVQIDAGKPTGLREVHTGSVPLRVADAQLAYRFREAGWTLELTAKKKPAGIRVETFQLLSLGEGVAYGMVAVSYFITGSPVDELTLIVPKEFNNVEFISRDVRQWTRDPQDASKWTVKLQRKIIGDYNLGLTYNQPCADGKQLLIGGIECPGVSTQTGFITVASHLNLRLKADGKAQSNLLEIDRDEVPANYRLLVNAPVLKTFKYVAAPHETMLTVSAFARGTTLPVVIEVMQLDTTLSVREDSATESVTRARYKVKNSAAQFLTLALPKGAMVWATRLVQTNSAGLETLTRIAASHDKATGELLIPLPRKRDPNDPTTLELEYGQVHDGVTVGSKIELSAPACGQKATFESWTVRGPADWAVLPMSGGSMTSESPPLAWGDLARVMPRVIRSWGMGFERASRGIGRAIPGLIVALLALVIALLFILARSRRVAGICTVALVFGVLTFVGMIAADAGGLAWAARDNLSEASFTQPVGINAADSASIAVKVMPSWRAYCTVWGLWALPLGGAVTLLTAIWLRRLRPVLAAAAFTMWVFAASQFTIGGIVLAYLFTWGAPMLMAIVLIRIIVKKTGRRSDAAAAPNSKAATPPPAGPSPIGTAVLLLAATLWGTGCAQAQMVLLPPAAPPIERVDCKLTAEKDSMAVTLQLKISAAAPTRLRLVDANAILLSPAKISDAMQVLSADGQYFLQIKTAGSYSAEVKFLAPLAAEDAQQARSFKMALPMATTNHVDLMIPQQDLQVASPSAVRLTRSSADGKTLAGAIFAPGEPLEFSWKPRVRQTTLEQTVFYADLLTLWSCDVGFLEGRHLVDFQIAQGELKDIDIAVPEGMTVTAVEGAELAAWRFDPTSHSLEAKLSHGTSGTYRMIISTQIVGGKTPYKAAISPLVIRKAARQRGKVGLASTPAVYVTVNEHPQAINVDDFVRDAAALRSVIPAVPGAAQPSAVARQAWRVADPNDKLSIEVFEVKPEVRTAENALFTVADDRLIYNAQFLLEISKAGIFSADLRLPEGFDIDTLTAPEVSHWDESTADGVRTVQIHFNKKVLGTVSMNLSLSKAVSELPKRIVVPRIEAVGSVKHSGQVVISSDRGVRLSVGERSGVSEVNPLELDVRTPGAMAFRLLGPAWQLALDSEVVEPRIDVEFLHQAKISEGLVRHTHYIRYRLSHAGTKTFDVQTPTDALGLAFSGPDIVRREEVTPGSGIWRIELGNKWFDRPYPLTVRYETRFDPAQGDLKLMPVKALKADLQRGFIVVHAGERMALSAGTASASLRGVDARNLPTEFGAGDLSNAAFCYSSAGADYRLDLRAQRHEAVALLEAEALETTIDTVMTTQGQSINHIHMLMRVGGKRHLETVLPPGAEVWSLAVNGRSTLPSLRDDSATQSRVVLLPLAQVADSQLPVDVDLIYVMAYPGGLAAKPTTFAGPRFDLPLRKVSWRLYLPAGMKYDNFKGGTLKMNESEFNEPTYREYDSSVYDSEVRDRAMKTRELAMTQIKRSSEYAQAGKQAEAWKENANAVANSGGDPALNEDMRVQLHRLTKQQALVGLVGSRGRLRQQTGQADDQSGMEFDDHFTQADAMRVQGSLNKTDSENLEQITDRMIQVQETAAGEMVQLAVNMPLRGRVLEFSRELQVKPDTEMTVAFSAVPMHAEEKTAFNWAGGVFATLLVLFVGASLMLRRA